MWHLLLVTSLCCCEQWLCYGEPLCRGKLHLRCGEPEVCLLNLLALHCNEPYPSSRQAITFAAASSNLRRGEPEAATDQQLPFNSIFSITLLDFSF